MVRLRTQRSKNQKEYPLIGPSQKMTGQEKAALTTMYCLLRNFPGILWEDVVATSDWVIIEVSDAYDNPSFKELELAIHEVFGDKIEYFIPIFQKTIGSYVSTSVLMQGYVFVKDCDFVRAKLPNVRDTRLFLGALVYGGKIQTIDALTIASLRRRLTNSLKKKLRPGTSVRVCDGALKGLIGEVVSLEEGNQTVLVRIKRLSRELLAPVPSTLVEEVDKSKDSSEIRPAQYRMAAC